MRRPRVEWMVAADDRILEILEQSGLALSPKVISYNIDYSRKHVADRLSLLLDAGLVDREERGMYVITQFGTDYIYGDLNVDQVDLDDLI